MVDLGFLALVLALVVMVYSLVATILGLQARLPQLVRSARQGFYTVPLLLLFATGVLVHAFVTHNFQVSYVAAHSNRAMDPWLTWVAFYAGNEGSLLFIALVFSILSSASLWATSRRSPRLASYASVAMAMELAFFLGIMIFLANPLEKLPFTPSDGRGINPLLTHPGMFFHPPFLMTGLVSVAIPFAYGMGALFLPGREGAGGSGSLDEWVGPARTWGLTSWAILGTGNLLGAWWAYTILGWGGYWGWDPVENVGFMPWLVMTAFIHSIVVQQRRGMFRQWNLVLIILAFGLAQFGMFLNRGGPVPSVHSFGQSTLGWTFLLYMGGVVAASLALFLTRRKVLESSEDLDSPLSREGAFLLNNLLFLGAAFTVFWGVIYPLVSDVFTGVTVTMGAPFYNRVAGPVFLTLVLLMGVGPLLPWRRGSMRMVRRMLVWPITAALTTAVLLLLLGMRQWWAILSFSLCALVVASILHEWWRGSRARHTKGEAYPTAFLRLLAANRPRYGGYIVHLGVVMLAVGITGSQFFDMQRDVVLKPGEQVSLGTYTLRYDGATSQRKVDRMESVATVQAFRGGRFLETIFPQRIFYPDFNMSSTRAAIRSTPVEDLYVIPAGVEPDGRAQFRIHINPLVFWIWMAGPIVLLGTILALWPEREPVYAYRAVPSGTRPLRA